MRVKFTKASKKDGTLVTLSIAQFNNNDDLAIYGHYAKGEEFIAVIDGVPTVFQFNRLAGGEVFGRPLTATTKAFPRHLRLPSVGRPVYAEVTEIR